MLKFQLKGLSFLKTLKSKKSIYISSGSHHQFSFKDHKLITNDFLVVSDEIKFSDKPIVALESTIITHGLPYPVNLETAIQVENEIREQNALPATIAFLNGKLRVGLTSSELEQTARGHKTALKVSRRDLAYLLANKDTPNLVGGTTVSTTMIAAHAAGIPIFCTGGIGGVHRDYAESMDVSADLQELARTPVAVISSGIKSILDIQKTLEYLETLGVCVYTLSKNGSKEFPSFFTPRSRFEAAYNCLNEVEAAKFIHTNLSTGLNMGMLIGVPIPEEYAAEESLIETAIQEALADAKKNNLIGKKVTPFLLERINVITKGHSLASNIALIRNNAKTSAKIAVELKKLQAIKTLHNSNTSIFNRKDYKKCDKMVTLIGGINLDNTYKLTDEKTLHLKGVTQPVRASSCLGGVARNMAEALIRLGAQNTFLFSSVGQDISGKYVTEQSELIGFDTSKWLHLSDRDLSTGSYNAIFDTRGELMFGCGDMRAHDKIVPSYIKEHIHLIDDSAMCVIDADIPIETITYITNFCQTKNIPVWYNPTDLRKSTKVVEAGVFSKLTFMSPNTKELFAIFSAVVDSDLSLNITEKNDFKIIICKYKDILTNLDSKDLKIILKYLVKFVPVIILSRGPKPLMLACAYDLNIYKTEQLPTRENISKTKEKIGGNCYIYKFPVLQLEKNEIYMNESGAGDSMSAGIIYGILNNYTLGCSIYNGILSAKLALLTSSNISPDLSYVKLDRIEKLLDFNDSNITKEWV